MNNMTTLLLRLTEYAGHHFSYTLRPVICDSGTYGDFSIEYDNNNNKSNFDLKQATNALRIFKFLQCVTKLLFFVCCCIINI